jgi:hypothetical protein
MVLCQDDKTRWEASGEGLTLIKPRMENGDARHIKLLQAMRTLQSKPREPSHPICVSKCLQ